MISHRYKCIFIHIPKCAGATVERYFEELGARPYYDARPLPVLRREGLAKAINLYPHYFTFTFVRNPYARFISFYFFGLHRAACRNEHAGYDTLHECIELVHELLPIERREDLEGRSFGPHRTSSMYSLVYAWLHSKRQTDHVLDCNRARYFGVSRVNSAPCSFIGRQESFARDFGCVLDIVGAPRRPVESIHVLGDRRDHYSRYYDDRSRRLVEEIYSDDLERFGYEFERPNDARVLPPLCLPKQAYQRRRENLALPLRLRWSAGLSRIGMHLGAGFGLSRMLARASRRIRRVALRNPVSR